MANSADGLDCPVCWEPLRRPVFQCVNGHLICRACIGRIERSSNKVCPTCRVALGDQRIRCLEADRRADNPRPSPYTPPPALRVPAPRVPAPCVPATALPESAQRAARRFSAEACAKSRPIFNIVQGPRDNHDNNDTLVEIFISKISDELVSFGDEPLVSGGATFQVQLKSNTSMPADFAESLDEYLHARTTSPKMALEWPKTLSRYYFRCFEVLQTHMHILSVKDGGESEYRRIFEID